MGYCGLAEEDEVIVAKAARLVSGKWDATIEQVLNGLFLETASHSERAGGNAHRNWCASMQALGETCIAIAKREKVIHQ